MGDDDLGPGTWPDDLDWRPDRATESLQRAYEAVVAQAATATRWYLQHRRSKARWAKVTRVSLTVALGAGAVFPAISLADQDLDVASWGFVPFAIGGLVYGLDRALGHSSAWRRYMITEARLRTRLARAAVEWEQLRAPIVGRHPITDELVERLGYLRTLSDDLNRLVEAETEQWSAEFGETSAALQAAVDLTRPST